MQKHLILYGKSNIILDKLLELGQITKISNTDLSGKDKPLN